MSMPTDSRLVAFLYQVIYKDVSPSRLDEILSELGPDPVFDLPNDLVAQMAHVLATDLLGSE